MRPSLYPWFACLFAAFVLFEAHEDDMRVEQAAKRQRNAEQFEKLCLQERGEGAAIFETPEGHLVCMVRRNLQVIQPTKEEKA